jgi:1,4-alpha-glucan branching enzyme
LLAGDAAVRTQVRCGVDSHRARFGDGWRGGFWLPECAYAAWLGPGLAEAGVRRTCVELTRSFGLGAEAHLRGYCSESGIVLVPIDRATISLVWSDEGYPASGPYRDYHHHTVHHHNPWANDGSAYDHELALRLARRDARDFVSRTLARLEQARGARGHTPPGGPLVVCALDTELLGHWWYEGIEWLTAVFEESTRQGLRLVRLDDAEQLVDAPAAPGEADWSPSSWGRGGDLSTWSGPAVAEMAFETRRAELALLRPGATISRTRLRELMALQASDWPFMVSNGLAVPYARERFEGHRKRLAAMLESGAESEAGLRNLAVHAAVETLLAP